MTEAQAFYTVAEAARFVRYSETTIRDAYRSGALKVRYRTRRPVIAHDDLMAWMDAAPTREEKSA